MKKFYVLRSVYSKIITKILTVDKLSVNGK